MAASSRQLLAASFVGGVVLGAGGCYIYITHVQPPAKQATKVDRHRAADLGIPETEALRVKQGYVAAFDYRTKNPKWVLEHITEESANGTADRKRTEFYEDKTIEPWLRSRLAAYSGSGYDRGHLAPAADHKGSQQAMDDTFCLNNISPQVGAGFNRDYWARFEKFVKDCTRKCADVFVVTGPLWMPTLTEAGKWQMQYPLIGSPPDLVSVPTHFYKVVLTKGCRQQPEGSGSRVKSSSNSKADVGVAAFVMPNAPIDPTTPLTAFVVPLEPLEAVAGARFFPAYLNRDRMQQLDRKAEQVRSEGLQRMKFLDRQAVLDAVPHQLALPSPAGPTQPLLSAASAPAALPRQASQPNNRPVSASSMFAPSQSAAPAAPSPAAAQAAATTTAQGAQGAPQAADVVASDAVVGVKSDGGVPAAAIKPVAGRHYTHLCDMVACKLPPERFWERDGNQSSSSRRPSGGARGNNNRALTRR